jgi:hypothetical protein
VHYPVFGLTARETGASNALELGPMFMEIAEGLVLCLKCRRKTTNLPNGTKREHECNDLPLIRFDFRDNPHTSGHNATFSG